MNIQTLPLNETLFLLVAGAFGALAKDCLKDNTLKLPFVKDKELNLGFIGAVIIGASVGYLVDGSGLTAFMGGYTGKSLLEGLVVEGRVGGRNLMKKMTVDDVLKPKVKKTVVL